MNRIKIEGLNEIANSIAYRNAWYKVIDKIRDRRFNTKVGKIEIELNKGVTQDSILKIYSLVYNEIDNNNKKCNLFIGISKVTNNKITLLPNEEIDWKFVCSRFNLITPTSIILAQKDNLIVDKDKNADE